MGWPTVRLDEVLSLYREYVETLELRLYPKLSVRLYGKGVVLDTPVDGALVKMKRHQFARPGQVILSEIWAKKGAIGLVPPEGEGALCTSHFFLFDVREERIDRRWLQALFSANFLADQLDADAKGTTSYAAVRPKTLLACDIPLPPLAEQQRIVARIEEVAGKAKEAARLRKQMVEQVGALQDSAVSMYLQPGGWPSRSVGEIAGEKGLRNGKSVKPTGLDLGFYCLVLSAMRNGRINLADKKPVPIGPEQARQFLIRAGDVFIMRGNGSKSLCGLAGLAMAGSDNVIFPDLFIRVSLPQTVRPAYFVAVWNSGSVRRTIEDKAKTTSGIWKVNQGHIESTVISVPPVAEQDRMISSLERLQEPMLMLAEVQERVGREHDSLLPAVLDRAFKGEL